MSIENCGQAKGSEHMADANLRCEIVNHTALDLARAKRPRMVPNFECIAGAIAGISRSRNTTESVQTSRM